MRRAFVLCGLRRILTLIYLTKVRPISYNLSMKANLKPSWSYVTRPESGAANLSLLMPLASALASSEFFLFAFSHSMEYSR